MSNLPQIPESRELYTFGCDPEEGMIGGVCSGIARYIGVSPFWTRLVMLIAVFCYGVGLLPYIILWLAMPAQRRVE